VFEMMGSGLNTHEIAQQMRIATKTVETYRARIKEKLKCKDASELLKLAISWCRKQ
jgi:DNA-binding NarL/FixJ family response regulator